MPEEMKYNEIKPTKSNKKNEAVDSETGEIIRKKKTAIVKADKPVKTRKRGVIERLVVGLIGPDGLPAISRYIGKEVVLPAVKNLIVDSVKNGIDMVVYGPEGRGANSNRSNWNNPNGNMNRQSGYTNNRTNYNASYSVSNSRKPSRNYGPTEDIYDLAEYVIQDRKSAIDVLDAMREQVDQYGSVTVADFYDYIGIESVFTDNNYGWNDLNAARVMSVRGGYAITLPPADVI